MTLVRCRPGHHHGTLERKFFNEMHDMPFGRNFSHDLLDSVWGPRVAISENEKAYKVIVDLPGMGKEDVEITVEDNVLSISGERSNDYGEEDTLHRNERNYGKFERKFKLGHSFETGKIDASFENGVLTIELPKSEETMARKIIIKGK